MGEEGKDLTAATLHNLSIKRALTVSYPYTFNYLWDRLLITLFLTRVQEL